MMFVPGLVTHSVPLTPGPACGAPPTVLCTPCTCPCGTGVAGGFTPPSYGRHWTPCTPPRSPSGRCSAAVQCPVFGSCRKIIDGLMFDVTHTPPEQKLVPLAFRAGLAKL